MPLKVSFTLLRLAEQTGSYAIPIPIDKSQWSSEKVEEMYHRRIGTSLRNPSPAAVVNPTSHLAAIKMRTAIPAVAVTETKDVWMASTTSLTNVCTKISNSFGALLTGGASRACVHVVENTLSGNKGFNLSFDDSQAALVTTSSTSNAPENVTSAAAVTNDVTSDSKGLTAVLVWSGGPLRAGSARKVQELDQRVLCSIESREFFVEDVEGRGMHAMHLAEVRANEVPTLLRKRQRLTICLSSSTSNTLSYLPCLIITYKPINLYYIVGRSLTAEHRHPSHCRG